MPIELIILLASLFITWLVFSWLIKVVKASLSTALAIAAVVLVLQIVFGINNQQIWEQILNLPQTLLDLFFGK
jgi:predicted PurR-regulated permease PerM